MTEERMDGLHKARQKRSIEKRRAVEDAIRELKSRNETITFKAISVLASVSRQYLYNNFKDEISAYREGDRATTNTIEGVSVPTRTPDEARHVEALLRNKVDRLKKELGSVRQENARLTHSLEKERGLTEHFRKKLASSNI